MGRRLVWSGKTVEWLDDRQRKTVVEEDVIMVMGEKRLGNAQGDCGGVKIDRERRR